MAYIYWATRVLQWELQSKTKMQILVNYTKKFSKFGFISEIRYNEVGIASNRKSECYGETVFKFSTHRPSRAKNCYHWKILCFKKQKKFNF